MFKIVALCALLVAVQAVPVPDEDLSPKPYSFSYSADAEGGHSSRTESGDGSGRVVGSYTITDENGINRVVEYVADADGFRAVIKTNEPGTDNASPADVDFQSNPLPNENFLKTVAAPVAPVVVAPQPRPVSYVRPQATGYDTSRYVLVPIDQARNYYGYPHH